MPAGLSALDEAQIVSQHREGIESPAGEGECAGHATRWPLMLLIGSCPIWFRYKSNSRKSLVKQTGSTSSEKRRELRVLCFAFVPLFDVILHVPHLIGQKRRTQDFAMGAYPLAW